MLTVLRLQLFHVVAVLFYAANRCLRGIVIVLHKIILLQVLYSVLPNVMTHGCSVRSPMTAFITAMSCYELTVCVWSDKKTTFMTIVPCCYVRNILYHAHK